MVVSNQRRFGGGSGYGGALFNYNGTVNIENATFSDNGVSAGGGHVSLDPEQATHVYGDVVTLTATADTSWTFAGWSGDLNGSTGSTTLLIDADKSVSAIFSMAQVATHVELLVTPSSLMANEPITLTARVTQTAELIGAAMDTCSLTGTVAFSANGNSLGQASLDGDCQATLTLDSGLPGGSYEFQAIYTGDTTYQTSSSSKQMVVADAVDVEQVYYLPIIGSSGSALDIDAASKPLSGSGQLLLPYIRR